VIADHFRNVAGRSEVRSGSASFWPSAGYFRSSPLSATCPFSGAALEAPNQCGIPSRFVLAIPGDGLRLACRVKWRKEHRIGVQFG
jgi:hypothetical protein